MRIFTAGGILVFVAYLGIFDFLLRQWVPQFKSMFPFISGSTSITMPGASRETGIALAQNVGVILVAAFATKMTPSKFLPF